MANRNTRYLNAGSYGCIYTPALPCPDGPPLGNANNKVSKIFAKGSSANASAADYEGELANNRRVQEINTNDSFTLTSRQNCRISPTLLTPDEKRSCINSASASMRPVVNQQLQQNTVPQIIYKRGDLTLNQLYSKGVQLETFLKDARNVIKGLERLYTTHVAHMDIKPQNVMYNRQEHRVNFLDFGLLTDQIDVYRNPAPGILAHPYPYYPPEFRLFFTSIFLNQNITTASALDIDKYFIEFPKFKILFSQRLESEREGNRHRAFWDYLRSILPIYLQKQYENVLSRFEYTTRIAQINDFRRYIIEQVHGTDRNRIKALFENNHYGACVDIYSMGVSLLEVVADYLAYASERNVMTHNYIVALLYIISGMVHPDPNLRLNPPQLVQVYDRFVRAMLTEDSRTKKDILYEIHEFIRQRSPYVNQEIPVSVSNTYNSISQVEMQSPPSSSSTRASSRASPSASPMDMSGSSRRKMKKQQDGSSKKADKSRSQSKQQHDGSSKKAVTSRSPSKQQQDGSSKKTDKSRSRSKQQQDGSSKKAVTSRSQSKQQQDGSSKKTDKSRSQSNQSGSSKKADKRPMSATGTKSRPQSKQQHGSRKKTDKRPSA